MSTPDEHRKFQFAELNKINEALRLLRGIDLPGVNQARSALGVSQISALGKLGLIQPRSTTFLTRLLGLSPGELRLFQDAELGWLVEAISEPGAQPVRRYVSNAVALRILSGDIDHTLEAELMAPVDEYIA